MGDEQHRYRRVPRSIKMTRLCIIGLLMAVVAISCSADVSAEYDSTTPEPFADSPDSVVGEQQFVQLKHGSPACEAEHVKCAGLEGTAREDCHTRVDNSLACGSPKCDVDS